MDKISPKKPSTMIIGATAVLSILVLILLCGWLMVENQTISNTVNYLNGENAAIKVFLEAVKEKKEQVIPVHRSELSVLIEEITRLATDRNIEFVSIQSQKPHKGKKDIYQKMPLEITVRSSFKDLANYLGALRELRTSTIIITQFKLSPDEESPQRIRGDILGEVLIEDAE